MRERILIPGVGAFFAAAVVCAFGVDAFTSYRERLAAAEHETHNMVALLADQARQFLSNTDQTLRAAVLAYDDWLNDPRRSADTGYRMLKSIKGGSDIVETLNWFETNGDRIASSVSSNPPAVNIRDREHFQVHFERRDAGMFMAAPIQARTFDGLIAVVSRRIDSPSGEFAGVASAILNMSYLVEVLKRYRSLGKVHASIYLRDGAYIAHHPDPEARVGRTGAHTRLFREELPKAEQGTYHGRAEVSAEDRIFSYRAVAGHPLVAQVSMTRAAALAPWYGRIGLTGGLALLAIVVAAIATGMIYRQTQRLNEERLRAIKAQFGAEDANRSKSEFLAHMSHELRTPMNAVLGFTEMMSKEVFGPIGSAKYREYLDDIAMSGRHLLHVVNNVLDLAKVEAGKWEMDEEPVRLRDFCLSTVQMVRERAREARIAIHLDGAAPPLTVRADPRLLRQILLNLIINSIKFSEPGGRVAMSWALRGDGAIAIEVRDTGVGMSPEDAKRVLQPFGRGSAYLARARHETGLGLPLCKRFAEMHGGALLIASALGSGTSVTVVLPRERVSAEEAPAKGAPLAAAAA